VGRLTAGLAVAVALGVTGACSERAEAVQNEADLREMVQRMRPLMKEDASRRDARRRLAQEIRRISELVGL